MSNKQIQLEADSAELRAQRLAAARKKLQTFRASRSSGQTSSSAIVTHSPTVSSSSSGQSRSPAPVAPLPLTEGDAGNARHPRNPARKKSKEVLADTLGEERHKLRKPRSKGSLASHRRQPSSFSANQGSARNSVMSVFDKRPEPLSAGSAVLGADDTTLTPNEIITTPATPIPDSMGTLPEHDRPGTPPTAREGDVTRNRLSAFSFGSKPPPRSPSPNDRRILRSPFLFESYWGESSRSPSKDLSTPLSRPPSLHLTKATPLAFGSPSAPGPSRGSLTPSSGSPSSPSKLAQKRHSHTRSNSISLPNLKLATRPNSLGLPTSRSIPHSPCSPLSGSEATTPTSIPLNGQRLKFEPSGRGAEAEKEKADYRKKALEKLTGGGRASPEVQEPPSEISLPDLDDEDVSSNSSSTRPVSDALSSFSFGRPASLVLSGTSSTSFPNGLSASPFSWSSPEQDEPVVPTRWSSGSGGFSVHSLSADDGLGFGIDLSSLKRASVTTGLSVLAEEDENDDDETPASTADDNTAVQPITQPVHEVASPLACTDVPIFSPTPTRLRELTLLSHASVTPARGLIESPLRQTSPTKSYGPIGRGRPRPLSGVTSSSYNALPSANSTPIPGAISTPKSANSASARRRAATANGSRGSSISYKKDADTYSQSGSSRDWSGVASPPVTSPPMTFSSPRFSGNGNIPRSLKRPCPRPTSLASLGAEGAGAGRILGEVDETDEEEFQNRVGRNSQESDGSWRDGRLELEMERDALKEDVLVWKERCGNLETRLEAERRETVVLRERMRKLSDRLSVVSAAPSANDQNVLIEDLRKELFGLTSQLERERSEKGRLLSKIATLEAEHAQQPGLLWGSSAPGTLKEPSSFRPLLPSVLADQHEKTSGPTSAFSIPEAIVTPATPIPSDVPGAPEAVSASTPDPNAYRMKAWGFPQGPIQPSKAAQRESFFGLSGLLHRLDLAEFGDAEGDVGGAVDADAGLDLPPISLSDAGIELVPHATSDRTTRSSSAVGSTAATQSALTTSSVSSSMGFLASYLPKRHSPPPLHVAATAAAAAAEDEVRSSEGARDMKLDFRFGCKCCVGEVIEV